VPAGSSEAVAAAADNAAHTARLNARAAAGGAHLGAGRASQTRAPLLKSCKVQSGCGGSRDTGAQASSADISDAYAALEARGPASDEEGLPSGSVLPAGGAVATGACVGGIWPVAGFLGGRRKAIQ
jgi:hypothetical protein